MRKPPTPPNPPRSSNPHLRLSREEPRGSDHRAAAVETVPANYKFPSPATPPRTAASPWLRSARPAGLVAARVDRAPVERRFIGSNSPCAVVHDLDHEDPDCAGRIMSSRDLVRQIESTLDRMQSRLSDFRTQMDEAFKFPVGVEGDDDSDRSPPPRAA